MVNWGGAVLYEDGPGRARPGRGVLDRTALRLRGDQFQRIDGVFWAQIDVVGVSAAAGVGGALNLCSSIALFQSVVEPQISSSSRIILEADFEHGPRPRRSPHHSAPSSSYHRRPPSVWTSRSETRTFTCENLPAFFLRATACISADLSVHLPG